jgi:hypothetical protein
LLLRRKSIAKERGSSTIHTWFEILAHDARQSASNACEHARSFAAVHGNARSLIASRQMAHMSSGVGAADAGERIGDVATVRAAVERCPICAAGGDNVAAVGRIWFSGNDDEDDAAAAGGAGKKEDVLGGGGADADGGAVGGGDVAGGAASRVGIDDDDDDEDMFVVVDSGGRSDAIGALSDIPIALERQI